MLYFIAYITFFFAWLAAVVHDAMHSMVAWVIVDVLLSPLGVIRGLLIWIGVA